MFRSMSSPTLCGPIPPCLAPCSQTSSPRPHLYTTAVPNVSVSKATLPTLSVMLERAYLLSRDHPQNMSARQAAHDLLDKQMDVLQDLPYYDFLRAPKAGPTSVAAR